MDDTEAPGLSAEDFARLQRGDGVVFRRVYDAYVGLIQYVVRRCGADAAAADDLVQETFMRLLRKAGDIQQPGAVKAWLVTTARHLTLDELSRQRRYVAASDEHADTADAGMESVRRELEIALVGELVEQISRESGDATLADFFTDEVGGDSEHFAERVLAYSVGAGVQRRLFSDLWAAARGGWRGGDWEFPRLGTLSGEAWWLELDIEYRFGGKARTL